jgi:phytol kinase
MLRDLLVIGSILCASRAALWCVCQADRRAGGGAELSRKMLHVAMGLILCPLPWLFDRPGPVGILCAVYVGLLVARRYLVALDNHVGAVIDGVGRKSLGEFLFPISVAILFWLARGDRVAYLAPMLILTLADAAAAVIGRRYGLCRYATPGGCKSVEGSMAFAMIAFATTHLSLLLLGDVGRVESVLIAMTVALTMAVVEALASGGWDNLLVPAGAFALLKVLTGMAAGSLVLVAAGACGVVLGLALIYALVPALAVERNRVVDG